MAKSASEASLYHLFACLSKIALYNAAAITDLESQIILLNLVRQRW
jgi:hypothetical protein